jgi:succinoglycan biosynthesis protein ExoV
MPHFESAARGAWQRAADLAGVTMIDPRDPPLEILTAIARCRVLLSEALHGIIVADAMRVPWVAIRPLARIHRPKWRDWAETVDVVPRFATLPPSTLAEWFGRSPVLASRLQRHAHLLPAAEPMIGRAARALSRAAQAEPQLSPDAALERCQTRMLDAVVHLRRHPDAPLSRITPAVRRSYLRREDDSAYEPVPIG